MSTPPLTLARAGLSAEDLVAVRAPGDPDPDVGAGRGRDGPGRGSGGPGYRGAAPRLDEAQERSRLPEAATALQDLHDLVVRARLAP
ncbi:hypothetical protein ACN24M_32845 [Streptomyces microflavus]|uniref:hypothetical protein n=1 Tax=Streptomyces microflavus TaxID=1919 RepID=UPI003B223B10